MLPRVEWWWRATWQDRVKAMISKVAVNGKRTTAGGDFVVQICNLQGWWEKQRDRARRQKEWPVNRDLVWVGKVEWQGPNMVRKQKSGRWELGGCWAHLGKEAALGDAVGVSIAGWWSCGGRRFGVRMEWPYACPRRPAVGLCNARPELTGNNWNLKTSVWPYSCNSCPSALKDLIWSITNLLTNLLGYVYFLLISRYSVYNASCLFSPNHIPICG